ncbi:MAG: VOC family protein [Pseudomonadota bacterium]
MIFANLMVTDILKSATFYKDVLSMEVTFYVDSQFKDHQHPPEPAADLILASLKLGDAQLMLQKDSSLIEELPEFAGKSPALTGTIYFRDLSVDDTAARLSPDQIVKGPFTQWYGMREIYFKDPDGYMICVGEMNGPAPS